MSLFSLLRKPEWEHRDASRRAAAVAAADDAELLAKLPDLARNDEDAGVRLAAVRRIDDLALLGDRMRNDADAAVRGAARQRFLQRLLDAAVAVPERERVVRVEEDGEILVAIAEQAPEAALRRLALERIQRPGLIAERCVKDPDPGLRAWLLERVEDVATLERIAERVRKSDKLLARTARERVQAARLAAGDPQATRERALAICEELDHLRRSVDPAAAERRDRLAQEWDGLRSRLDEAMARRVQGYFDALAMALAGPPEPAPSVPAESAPAVAEHAPSEPPREPDPALTALLAELEARAARLDATTLAELEKRWLTRLRQVEPLLPEEQAQAQRFRQRAHELEQQLREQARQRQALVEALPERVAALEAALAAGQVQEAQELQQHIEADRKRLRDAFPRALGRRLLQAEQELDRLAQWQRWSGNKARLRLIEQVEQLAGSGLHPDALAVRLKELQAEWQRLDETEAQPQRGEHPLAARFHAAGRRVLAPARPYFEKRSELRGARRDEVAGFITDANTRLGEASGVRELHVLRREVIDHLRLGEDLEHGVRRELARQLRDLLARINAALAANEAEGEAAKRKLLANLRRDLMHVELAAALPIARQAQATWKSLPRAARKLEDALWAELRELVDPWFAKADSRQRERHEAERATASEAGAILAELEALAQADAATLAHAETRLAAVQTRWRALAAELPEADEEPAPPTRERRTPRPVRKPARAGLDERAFDRAVAAVQAARSRVAEAARRDGLKHLFEASVLCDRIESAGAGGAALDVTAFETQLAALGLPADARAQIHARRTAPLMSDATATQRAHELIVLAELARGLESPEADRELRRRLQIERLSERLSGSGAAGEDLRGLLLEALGLAGVPPAERAALAARWTKVLAAGAS